MARIILWSTMRLDYAPVRPAGVHHLASWLRQHGHSVKVIDFCHIMSTDDLVAITEKNIDSETIAIGVSSSFWDQFFRSGLENHPFIEPDWVIDARDRLQAKYPEMYWLLGGEKSVLPEHFKYHWIPFIGYAEDSVLKWVDQNTKKLVRRDSFDITTMRMTYSGDNAIRPSEPLGIELARGCMFKCKFCSYPYVGKEPGTYIRNLDYLKEEFLYNYNEFGTTKYYFLDHTVNDSIDKIRGLADIAQSLPFKLEWIGYNRLDLVMTQPNGAQLLKDSGLRSSCFGIESFGEEASQAIGKGFMSKRGKESLLQLKEFWGPEITWYMSMISGLPGDTRESLQEYSQWNIDNEMYAWGFFGLGISTAENKTFKSEFDLNYKEYGYRFPIPGNHHYWENDYWNAPQAKQYARELNTIANEHAKLGAWMLAEVTGLGYTFDEVMHIKRKDHPWDKYCSETKAFVDRYVANQLR